MNTEEILYAKSHEYVRYQNGFYYIGVSDVLLNMSGAVTFIKFPQEGGFYKKGEIFGFIESDSCAFELFMPVSGTICAVNENLINSPGLINTLPPDQNWIVKASSSVFDEDKNDLMDYSRYKEGNM